VVPESLDRCIPVHHPDVHKKTKRLYEICSIGGCWSQNRCGWRQIGVKWNNVAGQEQDSIVSPSMEIPVGTGDYVVKPGECVASIAYEYGHYWKTILNHPANLELKLARGNHHILLPGDRLTIPPILQKEVSAETDKLHTFVLTGVTEIFQIRLLDMADKARANVRYVLVIGLDTFSGTTDEQGALKHSIPPNAQEGRLILFTGQDIEEIELRLGDLNPTSATTGAQARLTNLGLDCGPIDGFLGPQTRKAIKRFQKTRKLEPTGELDKATMLELESRHGS
jgi:Putative peptidoglycan binding domain/LysM domain